MIEIGGGYWLDKDENCFIIKEKHIQKDGKETWKNETYHATHEQVIRKIGDIALKAAIEHDIKAMVELLQGFKEKFAELKAYVR